MSININRQLQFISVARPHAESIYFIDAEGSKTQQEIFHKELNKLPFVAGATNSYYGRTLSISSVHDGETIFSDYIDADSNYFKVFDPEFILGDPFVDYNNSNQIIVNESFARKYLNDSIAPGYPIGENPTISDESSILKGIVKDFSLEGAKTKIKPLCFRPVSESDRINSDYTMIRFNGTDYAHYLKIIEEIWESIEPENPNVNFSKLTDLVMTEHREDIKFSNTIKTFTWISLFITVLGLFGVSWYNVEKRRKEIAIRKINGATISEVLFLICCRFIKLILIASAIAIPVAFYISNHWLRAFVYKINITVWTFILPVLFAFALGLITITYQSIMAATANPLQATKENN